MKIGSLFSGIGGIDIGFENADAEIIWNCEIDVKCRSVLASHWPGVPRFKDVRTVTGEGLRSAGLLPDALVGGFPCTDVSVAGRRAGLAGEQSGLFFEFARILDEIRPTWALIENVPGLLSSHSGEDMGTVIGNLVDLGYGVSEDMSPAIGGVKPTTGYSTVGVAYRKATTSHGPENEWERWEEAEHTNTLDAGSNVTRNAHAVITPLAVRRLTPMECLRLQGFPDDWLDGLRLADSVKYRMAGNAVAVPVVEWIARRMIKIDEQS